MIQFGMLAKSAPDSLINLSRRPLALPDGQGRSKRPPPPDRRTRRPDRPGYLPGHFPLPQIRKPEHPAGTKKILPLELYLTVAFGD
jgi:hypothetical protein